MFCRKCGQELRDGAAFCPKCGTRTTLAAAQPEAVSGDAEFDALVSRADELTKPQEEEVPLEKPEKNDRAFEQAVAVQTPPVPVSEPEAPKKRGRGGLIAAVVILAIALGALAGFMIWKFVLSGGGTAQSEHVNREAADGMENTDDERPEDDAGNGTDVPEESAVLDEAEDAIASLDFAGALEALEALEEPADRARYDALLAAAELHPEIVSVSAEDFPTVSLSIRHGGSLSIDQLTLTDNGAHCALAPAESTEAGVSVFTWQAADNGESQASRPVTLTIDAGGISMELAASYTPVFREAALRLVSADLTDFPTVRAYFRIEDAETGESVEITTPDSFTLLERVSGGEAAAREVRGLQQLGSGGLSVSLIADGNASAADGGLLLLKDSLSAFAGSLSLGNGGRAEVLECSGGVRQMCLYSEEAARIEEGIRNLFPGGETALYDTLLTGVANTALQGAPGCVIAIVAGPDSASSATADEVIARANSLDVPVYLIGVGSGVPTDTLRAIAEETGGQYQAIDSLHGLSDALNAIYSREMDLYVLEYETDPASVSDVSRTLSVTLSGGGLRAAWEGSFEPFADPGVYDHSGRYELFTGDVSWVEAEARCESLGGHLVTISSQEEMELIIGMAEAAGVSYLWLGGRTAYDASGNVYGYWVTGEDFSYQNWSTGEPTGADRDGTEENCLMLWNIESLGGWTWNDQRPDPIADGFYAGKIAYICEWE